MKYLRSVILGCAFFVMPGQPASAGDFDWLKSLNVEAKTDASAFKARLEARFNLGDVKVRAVLSSVDRPSDAYMVLRLGEISKVPVEMVLKQYKKSKGKGWGVLAKSLGIKPGSREFHDLKKGNDLEGISDKSSSGGKGKNKGKGKGKGKRK